MLFLTYWFVLFACVVYPVYWLVPVRAVRLAVLLTSCAVFHTHFAGPAGVLPIVVLAVLTYAAGLTRSRGLCAVVIAACVLALVFYKYTTFLLVEVVGSVQPHWHDYLAGYAHGLLPTAPPLAISFFVFEFVHYLVDVCRGSPSIKSPLHFGAYAIFWPSIWQRWHISLSTWIRDYVYIPLGGGRCGPVRKALNGLAAFALCGLWHGAGWNFLIWGCYHGIGLAVCSTYRSLLGPVGRGLGNRFDRYPQVAWALTLLYVGVGW